MMTFDLYLDSAPNTGRNSKEIHGTYFAEASGLVVFTLWHGDGDSPHLVT